MCVCVCVCVCVYVCVCISVSLIRHTHLRPLPPILLILSHSVLLAVPQKRKLLKSTMLRLELLPDASLDRCEHFPFPSLAWALCCLCAGLVSFECHQLPVPSLPAGLPFLFRALLFSVVLCGATAVCLWSLWSLRMSKRSSHATSNGSPRAAKHSRPSPPSRLVCLSCCLSDCSCCLCSCSCSSSLC